MENLGAKLECYRKQRYLWAQSWYVIESKLVIFWNHKFELGCVVGTMRVPRACHSERVQPKTAIRDVWCGGPESNRHVPSGTRDFKSLASTSSATPAHATERT